MIRASKFVCALLLAAASVGAVAAQTGPTGPATPPVTPPTQTTPAVVSGISEVELANLLRTMDPNVKTTAIKDGVVYNLKIQKDGWNYQIKVTSFASEIWIDSQLGSPFTTVPSTAVDAMAKLLQANWEFGPMHFSFDKEKDGRTFLFVGRQINRISVTDKNLAGYIDQFCKNVRDTYPVWSGFLSAVK